MKAALCTGLLLLLAFLTGCSTGAGPNPNPGVQPTISSMQISPTSMSIGIGAQQQFTATAHLSDGTTKDLTSTAQWSSSDSTIASVNSPGMVVGSASGTATITASSGTLQSTATLKVSAAAANLSSIAISPATPTMPINTTQQFTATGTYTDGSSADITSLVTWSSSYSPTATVSATGVVTAVAAGLTQISASLGSVSQSTKVTVTAPSIVSISVTPVGLTLG